MSKKTSDSNSEQSFSHNNSPSSWQNNPKDHHTAMDMGEHMDSDQNESSTVDDQPSNKGEIKSPAISKHDINRYSNYNPMAQNQSPSSSIKDDESLSSKKRSHSFSNGTAPIKDKLTMDRQQSSSSQNEKTKAKKPHNRVDDNKDDDDDVVCCPQSRTTTSHSDKEKPVDLNSHRSCQFRADKSWLDPQYHDTKEKVIKKPDELVNEVKDPPDEIDQEILDRIQGSIIGMALGDALGAHVEFRPHHYLTANPVKDLGSGGTWGLKKGQFTDDTSMALCLANSLVARRRFVPYDQLVRYKWWHKLGYMSSTGECFDIGAATRQSIEEFGRRQKQFAKKYDIPFKEMDYLSDHSLLKEFDEYCSTAAVAGNGALMRLAPVPLFFFRCPEAAVEFSGRSGQITHGDKKAYDACRYYGALIVGALNGYTKEEILNKNFYSKHRDWFDDKPLHRDIQSIAQGSYKKDGHDAGIRGKGYIVNALEAALWAFWSDEDSFEKGALAAVNLGDDTDTTAAIYGQLAGAYYGYKELPKHWLEHVYAKEFMKQLSKWIAYEGECWGERYEAKVSQS